MKGLQLNKVLPSVLETIQHFGKTQLWYSNRLKAHKYLGRIIRGLI